MENPNDDSFLLLEEADASSSAFRFELRSGLDMAALVIYSINNKLYCRIVILFIVVFI